MTLWIVLTAMVAIAAAGLAVPLVRRYDRAALEQDAVLAVLRDQLADIDVQVANGAVATSEADALRTELKRRLLNESRVEPGRRSGLRPVAAARLALASAVVVALGATGLYAVRGRPDLTTPTTVELPAEVATAGGAATSGTATTQQPQVEAMVGQLEARMAKTPADPKGWQMLGWSYFQTGRFDDSAKAYAKAVALDPSGPGNQSALGEALVQAAGGVVTPTAATAFAAARALDAGDARARYFIAVQKDQRGDRKGALDDWLQLLREAPAGAQWAPELRAFVEKLAKEQGIDIASRLPAPAAAPVQRGPTAADIAAAKQMAPGAQQEMIRGMVDNLAARLKTNPRDADGWAKLIRARSVLGDAAGARAALEAGRAAFADTPATQAALTEAARGSGVS